VDMGRPWGGFVQFTLNESTTVKILILKPNQRLSLQYHHKRKEFWKFLDNPAEVTLGKKVIQVKVDDEIIIEPKMPHRIKALDKTVRVLEISFGFFDENDQVRLEDDYGRDSPK